MNSYLLPVQGMDCASCANAIQKVMSARKDVESITVNVAAESATISTKEAPNLVEWKKAIDEIGFHVPESTVRFSVQDIDCASCAKSIETWLGSQTGILSVDVNVPAQLVQVTYLETLISPVKIKHEIKEVGFTPVLESNIEEAEQTQRQLYHSFRNRLLVAVIATLPVFVISMFMIDFPGQKWVQFGLTSVVLGYSGRGFFTSGWNSLKAKAPNMDVLVSIGSSAAYGFSVVALFFPEWFEAIGQEPHLYFETTATIITLILTGNFLEKRATAKTTASLKSLLKLQAKTALVKENDEFQEVEVELVSKGSTVLIKPGERVPLDGVIIQGSSSFDESMLTGESLPLDKLPGDEVFSGTLNQTGSVTIKVTRTDHQSTLQQIISLVKEAQGTRPPIQRLGDQVSAIFVPTVVTIAMLTFGGWFFFGPEGKALSYAILTSVAVLIIACPCAMGLAAPTAVMVGIGRGAQNGILIRGGEALEQLTHVSTVVLDKTGTVTTGKISVNRMVPLNGIPEKELLSFFASAELPSEHPIGKSVVEYAKIQNIPIFEPHTFRALAGSGIEAEVKGRTVTLRKISHEEESWIEQYGFTSSDSVIVGEIDHKKAGLIGCADTLAPTSKEAVRSLKTLGVRVIMLSGDKKSTAESIASQVGIDEVIAEVLPHEKASVIERLQTEGEIVAMVGDGINDAPSLARADVGIAMGRGTDIAIESSKVVLLNNDLRYVSKAFQLSKQTVLTIKQNLFWAFIYNILAIPLAAGVFYTSLGWLLSPMIGAATMALSDVFVIGNSIALKFKSISK